MNSNPLFKMLNGGQNMPPLVQEFMNFRNQFKGDPRQQVQQMLNSGQISQEQYNRAVQTANDFHRVLQMLGR